MAVYRELDLPQHWMFEDNDRVCPSVSCCSAKDYCDSVPISTVFCSMNVSEAMIFISMSTRFKVFFPISLQRVLDRPFGSRDEAMARALLAAFSAAAAVEVPRRSSLAEGLVREGEESSPVSNLSKASLG